jgi:hypothetical protein
MTDQVLEDNHFIFRGHSASIDCVSMLNDEQFVSGGQDGKICLWQLTRKKRVCEHIDAHETNAGIPRWISSVCAAKMTDLCVTGSSDGFVRLWECNVEEKRLRQVGALPVVRMHTALSRRSPRVDATFTSAGVREWPGSVLGRRLRVRRSGPGAQARALVARAGGAQPALCSSLAP